jgi:prefoldin subunit 5
MLAEENSLDEQPEKFEHHITTINNTINEVCSKIDKLVNVEEFENECLLSEANENTDEY